MKRIVTAALTLCVAFGLTAVAQKATVSQSLTAEAALGAAIHQEEVEGNVEVAIASYKKIISQYASNRPLAAKAQYRLGLAYEKLGDAQARAAYERVTREFADQKDVASQASRRLAALSVPRGAHRGLPRPVLAQEDLDLGGISQDGRWMALTEWSTADGDLMIRDMTTGETRQLQKGTCGINDSICRFAELAILSSDARQIAYAWYDDSEIDGRGQLRIIAAQGGASPRVLVRNPDLNVSPIGWSPDGKYIVASTRAPDRTSQLLRVSVADGSVTTLKSLGWRLQGASLSPDGRFIAYGALPTDPGQPQPNYSLGEQHIYVLSIDDGKEVELVKTAAINRSPVWTLDGNHITFVSNLSGKFDLWSVPVRDGDNSTTSLLRRDIGDVRPVGMTRAGSYYYVYKQPGVEQVSIAELLPDGRSQRRETFVGINPTWSPDGRSIAFSRHRGDASDLVVRSIGAHDERVYAREGLRAGPPRWFPDSGRVLQDVVLAGRRASTALDVGRGEFKEAWVSDTYQTGIAALSPDGATLYFPTGHRTGAMNIFNRIVAGDLNTRAERQIVSIPETRANGFGFALSPDGRMLAVITTDMKGGNSRLAVVGIDGAGYREIHAPFRTRRPYDQVAWTKDNRSILFAISDGDLNGTYQIMRIGIEGGTPSFTGVSVKALSTFNLSPDGARIAFSTTPEATARHELLVIDDLPALVKDAR